MESQFSLLKNVTITPHHHVKARTTEKDSKDSSLPGSWAHHNGDKAARTEGGWGGLYVKDIHPLDTALSSK